VIPMTSRLIGRGALCLTWLSRQRGASVARPLVAIGMPATTRFKPLSAADSNCAGGRIPMRSGGDLGAFKVHQLDRRLRPWLTTICDRSPFCSTIGAPRTWTRCANSGASMPRRGSTPSGRITNAQFVVATNGRLLQNLSTCSPVRVGPRLGELGLAGLRRRRVCACAARANRLPCGSNDRG
jgi:hypothetical protein